MTIDEFLVRLRSVRAAYQWRLDPNDHIRGMDVDAADSTRPSPLRTRLFEALQ